MIHVIKVNNSLSPIIYKNKTKFYLPRSLLIKRFRTRGWENVSSVSLMEKAREAGEGGDLYTPSDLCKEFLNLCTTLFKNLKKKDSFQTFLLPARTKHFSSSHFTVLHKGCLRQNGIHIHASVKKQ